MAWWSPVFLFPSFSLFSFCRSSGRFVPVPGWGRLTNFSARTCTLSGNDRDHTHVNLDPSGAPPVPLGVAHAALLYSPLRARSSRWHFFSVFIFSFLLLPLSVSYLQPWAPHPPFTSFCFVVEPIPRRASWFRIPFCFQTGVLHNGFDTLSNAVHFF